MNTLVDLQLPTRSSSFKKFNNFEQIEELISPIEIKHVAVVEEKKSKWNPIGFAKVNNAEQAEEELKETTSQNAERDLKIKQESEIKNEIISFEANINEVTLENVKNEKLPPIENETKSKSSKKEKVVVFKKRKIDNVQQNLRERVDLNE